MTEAEALGWVGRHSKAVLATVKRDGRPHQRNIGCCELNMRFRTVRRLRGHEPG